MKNLKVMGFGLCLLVCSVVLGATLQDVQDAQDAADTAKESMEEAEMDMGVKETDLVDAQSLSSSDYTDYQASACDRVWEATVDASIVAGDERYDEGDIFKFAGNAYRDSAVIAYALGGTEAAQGPTHYIAAVNAYTNAENHYGYAEERYGLAEQKYTSGEEWYLESVCWMCGDCPEDIYNCTEWCGV